MKLHPRVSRSLVELVKRFEGLRRRAARLPDGGWTIGYGHTRSAREGVVVTPEDAEALLYYDLSDVAEKVDAWTFTPLNQNQFEALTAFAFNIGLENFRRSSVLKRVNEGQHLQAAAALELWRKAEFGGEDLVVDALVRRRAAEKAHFLTPPEGFRPSPSPVLRPTFDHSVIEAAAVAQAGRPAFMVEAPLDGEDAAAHLTEASPETPQTSPLVGLGLNDAFGEEPKDEDREAPPRPPRPMAELSAPAALLAAGAATASLHQLFPDKRPAADPFAPTPDTEAQPVETGAEPHPAPSIDVRPPLEAPVGGYTGFGASDPELAVPPAPPAPSRSTVPAAARRFAEEPPPFAEPPPFTDPTPFAEPPPFAEPTEEQGPADRADTTSLFDIPVPRPKNVEPFPPQGAFPAAPPPVAPLGTGRVTAETLAAHPEVLAANPEVQAIVHDHPPEPPQGRYMIYLGVGLLGVALFLTGLVSMLGGKATAVNLIIGLMGVVLLTPPAGYFLLEFLNRDQPEPEA